MENCAKSTEYFAKIHDSNNGEKIENKIPKQTNDVA
jgi:hypothetical protein